MRIFIVAAALLLLASPLAGCGTIMCGGYERFQVSARDTDQTKRQALAHNRQMDANGCK